jgi:hypothetical protein
VSRHAVLLLTVSVFALASTGAARSATRLPGFHSPSGNIACLVLPSNDLLCTIVHAGYAATLQSRCGGLDWHGFMLRSTGPGAVNCAGGILSRGRPSYVTLPYGTSWKQGRFTCSSHTGGVTCRNRNGHGLFVSRQSWRGW